MVGVVVGGRAAVGVRAVVLVVPRPDQEHVADDDPAAPGAPARLEHHRAGQVAAVGRDRPRRRARAGTRRRRGRGWRRRRSGESKRGRHSHSTLPLGATSAQVSQSDRKPYWAIGGKALPGARRRRATDPRPWRGTRTGRPSRQHRLGGRQRRAVGGVAQQRLADAFAENARPRRARRPAPSRRLVAVARAPPRREPARCRGRVSMLVPDAVSTVTPARPGALWWGSGSSVSSTSLRCRRRAPEQRALRSIMSRPSTPAGRRASRRRARR